MLLRWAEFIEKFQKGGGPTPPDIKMKRLQELLNSRDDCRTYLGDAFIGFLRTWAENANKVDCKIIKKEHANTEKDRVLVDSTNLILAVNTKDEVYLLYVAPFIDDPEYFETAFEVVSAFHKALEEESKLFESDYANTTALRASGATDPEEFLKFLKMKR